MTPDPEPTRTDAPPPEPPPPPAAPPEPAPPLAPTTTPGFATTEPAAPSSDAAPEGPGWVNYLFVSTLQLAYVFVLYVLSTGPLYWWIYEAYTFGSSPFLQRLYWPLVSLAESWPWFSDFLDWWIGLWIL